jgi:hypothetical protein
VLRRVPWNYNGHPEQVAIGVSVGDVGQRDRRDVEALRWAAVLVVAGQDLWARLGPPAQERIS